VSPFVGIFIVHSNSSATQGLRDAIGLAPVLIAHVKASNSSAEVKQGDVTLGQYAHSRHERALEVIRLTKTLAKLQKAMRSKVFGRLLGFILNWLFNIRAVRKMVAWDISGLGAK